MLTRRHFLAAASAAATTACATHPPSALLDSKTLKDIAKSSGLRFGNAIAYWGNNDGEGVNRPDNPFNDKTYMELVKTHCDIVVAENEFKRYTVQPVPGDYRFERANGVAKFAADNHMGLRGHTLLWNRNTYMPQWVQDLDLNATSAEAHLDEYFGALISNFDGQVYSWDVANETIDPETGEIRNTVFTKALGPGVMDTAFRIAKSHAPNAQLVYNDYMSWEKHSAAHRRGILKLLEDMKKRGTPIDALGIQGHLGTYAGDPVTGFTTSYDKADWLHFLNEVKDMGLDITITEFDVNDERLTANVVKRDQIVADYAREYLDMTLDFANVKEILTWGMVDHHSWLQDFWPREDGLDKRGTPFDKNYRQKPLYTALAESMAAAPKRAPLA
ncbi:endo-1,4-beta-xylanase [Litorimonas taeanensis]|uniref:Beta-xylanase n=1 Tax=Litorimonas taeanensis TaxID=568099 RepID=A0A420WJH1_9PROT|nr:endo-1,4-beta-xylanase [Litorimonas taeanensis]RKQ71157.1 endo-1,4-beta-xylanase [Litorimonas taeanensis]